jgi:hypothetical protein
MRKWVLSLFVLISLLIPYGAQAQEEISLSSLQVQIWPEYDNPAVLVIYQFTLSPTTTFPALVSIRIPAAAGKPYAVAIRQVDGSLYTTDYTREVSGEWANINITTNSSEVQVEYYDPQLTKNESSRHFQYEWPGDYAVSQFTIQVQCYQFANFSQPGFSYDWE